MLVFVNRNKTVRKATPLALRCEKIERKKERAMLYKLWCIAEAVTNKVLSFGDISVETLQDCQNSIFEILLSL